MLKYLHIVDGMLRKERNFDILGDKLKGFIDEYIF